jgi:hypothetical protein
MFLSKEKSRQGGYVGMLALLISVAILAFIMYSYFDKGDTSDKSPMERNIDAIDSAKSIEIQAEARAKAANELMNE